MEFRTISIKELETYMEKQNAWLIDLRSKEDYDLCHLQGAKNIPYDDLKRYSGSLPRDKILIFYCERGGMSLMAAKDLSRAGYHAATVIGGLRAWEEQRLN
ncbi:rhodanese-like domain-containing protein [Lachnospiraceae bacterium ZAX-1]